jgi:fatty-acyl-CoA synthase
MVVAVVAPKVAGELSGERVLALLQGRIARYKQPKQVLLVAELPKTALGKVRKEAVRQLVAAQSAAATLSTERAMP